MVPNLVDVLKNGERLADGLIVVNQDGDLLVNGIGLEKKLAFVAEVLLSVLVDHAFCCQRYSRPHSEHANKLIQQNHLLPHFFSLSFTSLRFSVFFLSLFYFSHIFSLLLCRSSKYKDFLFHFLAYSVFYFYFTFYPSSLSTFFSLVNNFHIGRHLIGDVKIPDEVEQIDASYDGHVSSNEHIPAHEKDHKWSCERRWIEEYDSCYYYRKWFLCFMLQ